MGNRQIWKELFNNFFKNYTEKVWGIDCKEIGKDWAAQRIKGLSLSTAIKFALFPNSKKRPKTLVDMFYYPRLGAGMLWEKFEENLLTSGIEVLKNAEVVNIYEENKVMVLDYKIDEKIISVKAKHVLFSNPLLDFIDFYKDEVPNNVLEAASKLEYRNHINFI